MNTISSRTILRTVTELVPSSIEDLVAYLKNPIKEKVQNNEYPIYPVVDKDSYTYEYLVMHENGDVYCHENRIFTAYNSSRCHDPILMWKHDDPTYGGWIDKEKWESNCIRNPRRARVTVDKSITVENF